MANASRRPAVVRSPAFGGDGVEDGEEEGEGREGETVVGEGDAVVVGEVVVAAPVGEVVVAAPVGLQ